MPTSNVQFRGLREDRDFNVERAVTFISPSLSMSPDDWESILFLYLCYFFFLETVPRARSFSFRESTVLRLKR